MAKYIWQLKNNKNIQMKKIFFLIVMVVAFFSCSIFHKSDKVGCPSNGKNIGAEKLVIDNPRAAKLAKDAPKYKADKKILSY